LELWSPSRYICSFSCCKQPCRCLSMPWSKSIFFEKSCPYRTPWGLLNDFAGEKSRLKSLLQSGDTLNKSFCRSDFSRSPRFQTGRDLLVGAHFRRSPKHGQTDFFGSPTLGVCGCNFSDRWGTRLRIRKNGKAALWRAAFPESIMPNSLTVTLWIWHGLYLGLDGFHRLDLGRTLLRCSICGRSFAGGFGGAHAAFMIAALAVLKAIRVWAFGWITLTGGRTRRGFRRLCLCFRRSVCRGHRTGTAAGAFCRSAAIAASQKGGTSAKHQHQCQRQGDGENVFLQKILLEKVLRFCVITSRPHESMAAAGL